MSIPAILAIVLVAAIHVFFGYKEYAAWHDVTAMLLKVADADGNALPKDAFNIQSAVLGKNFAVYNWVIAFGLLATMVMGSGRRAVQLFVLAGIAVVGAYGGITTDWPLLAAQCAPAVLAFIIVLFNLGGSKPGTA